MLLYFVICRYQQSQQSSCSSTNYQADCLAVAGMIDTRSRKEAVKDSGVCDFQKCCLMESACINTVSISKQELLCVSQRRSQPLPLTMGDGLDQAERRPGWERGSGKDCFALVCSCHVPLSSLKVI